MSHQAQQHASNRALVRNSGAVLLMSAIAFLLGGCDSGGGGTDVTIGSGQNMDPVTLDFPVFYVKRPVPDPEDDELANADARELLRFEIGADLFMRDRASTSAAEVNLTSGETQGLGDIRDVSVNYDGSKVLFSMRARFIEDADEEDQPTWNIWEYDVASRQLRRIITSDIVEETGHDIMPHYLPDGRIVFSSTRQATSRAILLDENKPQFAAQDENDNEPAFVLHVMDANGTNIHQISFNQSHDLDPEVLPSGRVVFTRWEHHIDDNQFDLYSINPDGSDLQLLYGANSHQTGTPNPAPATTLSTIQFLNAKPLQDGRTLTLARPFQGTGEGGDLVLIDTDTYVDNTRAASAGNIGMTGPAQTRALPTDVRTIPGPSPGGRYRTAQPLYDGTGRLLVSWSQCRLVENTRIVPCTSDRLRAANPVEAPPLYGIYVYNVRENTQRPIVIPQEGSSTPKWCRARSVCCLSSFRIAPAASTIRNSCRTKASVCSAFAACMTSMAWTPCPAASRTFAIRPIRVTRRAPLVSCVSRRPCPFRTTTPATSRIPRSARTGRLACERSSATRRSSRTARSR